MTGVVLSSEALAYIASKAATIHHGQIILDINADKPEKIEIQVIEKERFHLSDAISAPRQRPRNLDEAPTSTKGLHRG